MPLYEYKCTCGQTAEIIKPVSSVCRPERCHCGDVMQRVYTPVRINFNNWKPEYRHGEPVDGDVDFRACGGEEEYLAEIGMTAKQEKEYQKAVEVGEAE